MSAATLARPMSELAVEGPLSDPVVEGASRRRRRERAASSRRAGRRALLTALGFGVAAALLRLVEITAAYDLFIDEATYAAIARDSTLVTGPMLHGMPFLLHPPIALLLLAAAEGLLGTQDLAALVAGTRPVVAIVGALTVVVLYLALHRAGLRRAAVIAAALVALDPFIISFDSRVMLEAFAQLFAAVTVAGAIAAATAPTRTRWRWVLLTGLAGAATFGAKETFGLVVLAALVLVALTAPRGERRGPLVAVVLTLGGYGLVNLAMIAWGGIGLWWSMRTDGLFRLLGTEQPTGFKAEGGHGSFWDGVLANGLELGATYAILAVGGIASLLVVAGLLRARPGGMPASAPASARAATRVVALWAVCACGYLAYAIAFGSLEEQMFYIAAAPCAAALAIGVMRIARPAIRRTALIGVGLLLLAQAAVWVHVHSTPDDVYAQFLELVPEVAPEGSTMALTEETAQFVLTGYDLGQWASAADLVENDVEYVLLSDRLVEQGYGLADAAFAESVRANGQLVLSVAGREGDLQLYDVKRWTSARGVDAADAAGGGS